MGQRITPDENARAVRAKRVGAVIAAIWFVPGLLLSAIIGHPLPALIVVPLALTHLVIVSVRSGRTRRAHRVAFWAGEVDTLEPPTDNVWSEIRRHSRLR